MTRLSSVILNSSERSKDLVEFIQLRVNNSSLTRLLYQYRLGYFSQLLNFVLITGFIESQKSTLEHLFHLRCVGFSVVRLNSHQIESVTD
jgi:hypothetical protein